MSSPKRKNRTTPTPTPMPESIPILSLPYDLVLSCVARVSRLYYPTLSLVSKSFRSLIASPELYNTRSVLGLTESCLYVCIQPLSGEGLTWYTLCRRPDDKTLINETKTSDYVLATVPIPDTPGALFTGLVTVGSNIYNIGGSDFRSMSKGYYSRVTILDCRSHTLSEAPSLRVGLCLLSASVIDKKIYVAGLVKDGDSNTKNSFEVFDTEAQRWDTLPSEIEGGVYDDTASIDGKFHVVTNRDVVSYDPKEGRWEVLVGTRISGHMFTHAYCVIDNVLYSASSASVGVFRWYDTEVRMWKILMGLVGLPKLSGKSRVRLANYGGKMGFLWEGEVFQPWPYIYRTEKKIWCAEIALERRNNSREIWGKLEWFDHVLTVPGTSYVVKVLAATV